jgi:hypothetical protein
VFPERLERKEGEGCLVGQRPAAGHVQTVAHIAQCLKSTARRSRNDAEQEENRDPDHRHTRCGRNGRQGFGRASP